MSITILGRSLLCSVLAMTLTGMSGQAWSADSAAPAATTAATDVPSAPGASSAAPVPAGDDTFLLTIFLRHDQSKTVDEINQHLKQTGWFKDFPPAGVEIVSWYVMMGIGQVVTLRVPPDRLRDVNLAIEQSAWGAFATEFYPTYDYKPIAEAQRQHRS